MVQLTEFQHLYITDLGKIGYVVLYLPIVFTLLLWIFSKAKSAWPLLLVVALVLLTLPFWDVYMIGRDAKELCREKGGLHVYKTVEAEGVAAFGSEYWLNHGFKYVEHAGIGPNKFFKKYRDMLENGQVVSREIPEFTKLRKRSLPSTIARKLLLRPSSSRRECEPRVPRLSRSDL